MTYLLFPGRHHLLTQFQLEYLTLVTQRDIAALRDVYNQPLRHTGRIDAILWAITSANHHNTRRNPLPGHRREAAIEEFADWLDVDSFVYHIDDLGATPRFAEYVLKKIEVDSRGRFQPTPRNTIVGCSTPSVIELYDRLGFQVLPFELADLVSATFSAETPWELLEQLVRAGLEGRDWRTEPTFLAKVARATRRLYTKYRLGDDIIDLFRHPLLTEDGDLTATRDYNTYTRSFDSGAARKYELIKDLVRPGRIVDIGCCTGSLLAALTRDSRLRESDFYGIEIARHLYTECLHRKEQGAFANENVFFHQRNFAAGPIFAANSVDTFTTFSLTHEVESYLGRPALLAFIELLFGQLALRGRWLNVDVIGPDNPDQEVLLWANDADGHNDEPVDSLPVDREACRAYLDGLSTRGRFLRFARDFRHDEGYQLAFRRESHEGREFFVLRLGDACEFLSKKDYTDNWASEMHETFCHWSFADWCRAAEEAGFQIDPASKAYVNPWLVENRYRGKAELFERTANGPVAIDYPVTNMLLVAEKQ